MMSSTIIGCLLSIVALGTLVDSAGQKKGIQLRLTKVTPTENDYYGDIDIQFKTEEKKTTIGDIAWPIKKELPSNMKVLFHVEMEDAEPIDYLLNLCDAFEDEAIGKSFMDAGEPKDTFPKACPITEGDWKLLNWNPPVDKLPPGIKDGPFKGYSNLLGDDEESILFTAEFEGDIFESE